MEFAAFECIKRVPAPCRPCPDAPERMPDENPGDRPAQDGKRDIYD